MAVERTDVAAETPAVQALPATDAPVAVPFAPGALTAAQVMALQRSAGNQATAEYLERRLSREEAPAAPTAAPVAPTEVTITYGAMAEPDKMTAAALTVLKDILRTAKIDSASISSTARTPTDQARVMFNNLEGPDPEAREASERATYGAAGEKVIDVYVALKKEKKTADEIKAAMKAKIDELGPTNVSHHISDPTKLTVFDVGPASIPKDKHDALNTAGKAEEGKSLSKFIPHPPDKGFHFEVKV